MKATGIVRRIDDLGRVVIPKEIRRTLRIREGDPLEIFTDREGEIILKKYSPIGEFGMPVKLYAESLSQTMGCTVCITDTDQVIAVSGAGKKDLEERFVRKEFLQVLGDREVLTACQGDDRYVKVTEEMNEYEDEVISPIISAGDIIGAVVLLNKDKKKHFGEVEQRVAVSLVNMREISIFTSHKSFGTNICFISDDTKREVCDGSKRIWKCWEKGDLVREITFVWLYCDRILTFDTGADAL